MKRKYFRGTIFQKLHNQKSEHRQSEGNKTGFIEHPLCVVHCTFVPTFSFYENFEKDGTNAISQMNELKLKECVTY